MTFPWDSRNGRLVCHIFAEVYCGSSSKFASLGRAYWSAEGNPRKSLWGAVHVAFTRKEVSLNSQTSSRRPVSHAR